MVFVEGILFSEREVKGMSLAAIYAGRGTSGLSIRGARVMLEEKGLEVTLVTAKELATTLQEPNCRLLVMPGGRDRPYHASLGEEGALRIRQFVEKGGSYLGLCAGAYFASARVLFQPGTDMQVDEQRPLALFPGTAWGAATGSAATATRLGESSSFWGSLGDICQYGSRGRNRRTCGRKTAGW